MKRLAWLLLAVILSFNTVGFVAADAPTAFTSATIFSPPAQPDNAVLGVSIPGYNAVCHNFNAKRVCGSVDERKVTPNEYVIIYGMIKERGVGVPGKIMTVSWRSRGLSTCTAVTDSDGMASCRAYFRGAVKGHKVWVKVTIGTYKVSTYFTSR